jgi:hypothetical protein
MVNIVGGNRVDAEAQIKVTSMESDDLMSTTVGKRRYNTASLTQRKG